jgi:hypothetical protein
MFVHSQEDLCFVPKVRGSLRLASTFEIKGRLNFILDLEEVKNVRGDDLPVVLVVKLPTHLSSPTAALKMSYCVMIRPLAQCQWQIQLEGLGMGPTSPKLVGIDKMWGHAAALWNRDLLMLLWASASGVTPVNSLTAVQAHF